MNNESNEDPLPENVEALGSTDLQEPLLQRESSASTDTSKDIVFRCCSRRYQVNHNVFLTLVLDVLYGVAESFWSGTVFVAYLKRLGRDQNGPVGDIEAVNGLAVLFSALPVGYLADKYGRSKVIASGGVLFILTVGLHVFVMQWIGTSPDPDNSQVAMILLAVVMGLWGIGGGIVSGPCQALYADSIPAGERTKYYFYIFVCYLLASALGPILSIILFQTIGDEWDMSTLRIIIYVGLGFEFVNAILMMFFDDKKALDEDEEDEHGGEPNVDETVPLRPEEFQDEENEEMRNNDENPVESQSNEISLSRRRRWIPYILFGSSVIMSIGSGMTVKFFPLFFKDEVGMTPTEVQVIYVIVPVAMVACSGIGTSMSAWFGRVQTSLLLEVAGISCLISMVFFKKYLDSHPFVLVPVYVIRTALMNAPYPLQESILMDFVPKNERARWKSLESIAQFGWCGSAALGGYFSDRWDYTFTFLITAVIQTAGALCFALLLPLVPRKEDSLSRRRSGQEAQTTSDEEVDS